jgi:aspartyl-tRNA synthetase
LQIDLEMSFAKGEQVMQVIERLLVVLWDQLSNIKIEEPIQRMTYHEAMLKYGSDKPDLRLGMEVGLLSYAVVTTSWLTSN